MNSLGASGSRAAIIHHPAIMPSLHNHSTKDCLYKIFIKAVPAGARPCNGKKCVRDLNTIINGTQKPRKGHATTARLKELTLPSDQSLGLLMVSTCNQGL